MSNGDDLPAQVSADVSVTLGEQGEQLLGLLSEVRSATTKLAVARQKLNENGYDILISTTDAGEMVIKIVNQ